MTREETLKFIGWLKFNKVKLYGARIGVVSDPAPETLGQGKIIIAADPYKKAPKRGTIVLLGAGVDIDDEMRYGFQLKDRIIHNTYGGLQIAVPNKDGSMVKIEIFHALDIYLGCGSQTLGINIE